MVRALNTYDREGVVHAVQDKPTDEHMGRTPCGLNFTWPIYGAWTATRWTGTHDNVSCLTCLVLGV